MKTEPRIIFIGYTAIDINITPNSKTVLPGGGAYFASIAASRVHQPIGLITRIGNDYDTQFLFSRVLPDGVHRIHDKSTTKSTQIYKDLNDLTDRDMILERGVSQDVCPQDIPTSWLKNAKIIAVTTMPPQQQKEFITFLKQYAPHALLTIDTDIYLLNTPEKKRENKKIIEENFRNVDLVFANRVEYQELQDVINNAPEAVIKLDEEGAFYTQRGKILEQVRVPKVMVQDATGAGDVFAGTFLASRIQGLSIKESLQEAANTATTSVTQVGMNHLFI